MVLQRTFIDALVLCMQVLTYVSSRQTEMSTVIVLVLRLM